MSAVDSLSIILEHDIDEQYQYQPGEILRGNIYVTLMRPTFLQTIYITIKGEGSVSWEDEATGYSQQATETYVDASKAVVDARDRKPLSLNKGNHNFPFEYQLPENLPSSFIGKYGSVTYILKATVQGIKSIDTSITSEPFLVLRYSELPNSINTPVQLSSEKRIFTSCHFGKISARCSLDRQGGIPGEDLLLQAEIKNRSYRTITALQAAVIMTSTYHAQNKKTQFKQMVNRKRDEFELNYNEGRRWNFVRLTIPPYIPESKLDYCDIIEISYSVQFRVEYVGGGEVRIETPFLIGSNPAGLEIPDGQVNQINRQWMVGTNTLQLGDDAMVHDFYNHEQNSWHQGVPELREHGVTTTNPLFRQGSFMTPHQRNGQGDKYGKNLPAEVIENTRL